MSKHRVLNLRSMTSALLWLSLALLTHSAWAYESEEEEKEALQVTGPGNPGPNTPAAAVADPAIQGRAPALQEPAKPTQPNEDYQMELTGFRSYTEFRRVKEQLRASFPQGTEIFEKKLTRGRVLLAIRSSMAEQDLKSRLSSLVLEPGTLRITDFNDRLITARFLP